MPVEQFTRDEFEAALPMDKETGKKLWEHDGVEKGEHVYRMPVKDGVMIRVRSSVNWRVDVSDPSGENSIRCWLTDGDDKPLGNKIKAYVTREPGWRKRMTKTLRELYVRGMQITHCPEPDCGKPMGIYVVKKETRNKGRIFECCWDHKDETFQWLDNKGKSPARVSPLAPDEVEVVETLAELDTIKARVAFLKDQIANDAGWCIYVLEKIYSLQELGEKDGYVKYRNDVGFTPLDAEILCSFASQFEKKGSLSQKQMDLAHKKCIKYARQIHRVLREDFEDLQGIPRRGKVKGRVTRKVV